MAVWIHVLRVGSSRYRLRIYSKDAVLVGPIMTTSGTIRMRLRGASNCVPTVQHLEDSMTTLRGGRIADAMVNFPKTHGLDSVVEDIRALFVDDHVHMALIVDQHGRLVTTIERPDLAAAAGDTPAAEVGTLIGRTVRSADPLDATTAALLRKQRRRLAVVDDVGQLLGLLCLKRSGTGYCTDEGIRERALPAGTE